MMQTRPILLSALFLVIGTTVLANRRQRSSAEGGLEGEKNEVAGFNGVFESWQSWIK